MAGLLLTWKVREMPNVQKKGIFPKIREFKDFLKLSICCNKISINNILIKNDSKYLVIFCILFCEILYSEILKTDADN